MPNLKPSLVGMGLCAMLVAASPAQDWLQWGGTSMRNNAAIGRNIPTDWDVGEFERRTGKWNGDDARNIKWVAKLGNQTFGTPVIADGRIYVSTNNGAGYLKRYPRNVDLGCVLCFRESDGEFLWQYSSEKLPTGRVHDWPLQGIFSTPLVEGQRLWFVNNRGEVVCADADGFYDETDDGPVLGVRGRLFEASPKLTTATNWNGDRRDAMLLRTILRNTELKVLPAGFRITSASKGSQYLVFGPPDDEHRLARLTYAMGALQISKMIVRDGKESFEEVITIETDVMEGIEEGEPTSILRLLFSEAGVELPSHVEVQTLVPHQKWLIDAEVSGTQQEFQLQIEGDRLVAYKVIAASDKREADVVWKFDMMKELGVRQHNLAICSITSWEDTLFVSTSNGVDEGHLEMSAPDAPAFFAMNKHTGRVLWTDNSPGTNVMHGNWSSPAVAVLGGVPQVIFCGGDGWVYSFRADVFDDGKPQLLWKFDANPKDSKWALGGVGTRNNIVAIPVIHDGLVYVAVGQDPEHGEGDGHLWAIDPTKKLDGTDVSPQIVMKTENNIPVKVPHRRIQALIAEDGEFAIENPDSAAVWHYTGVDLDQDGEVEFEEKFHRTLSSVAIKGDLLFASDLSGLIHCLDAKTGEPHWTCDLLANCWGSPLIVEDKVYIGDEDGDVAILRLSADWTRSAKESATNNKDENKSTFLEPLHEVNIEQSIYSTPVVANNVLYITSRTHLIAIEATGDEDD